MAVYRQVHVTFWQDAFVLDLTPEEKYFYLYLMTNSKTSQCGIYELPYRIMETETGYNRETVTKLIKRFEEYDKVIYNEKTKEIMVLNWLKFNSIKSPKVRMCVEKEIKAVKTLEFLKMFDTLCIQYGYSIDTLSIDYGEEEEKEKEKEKEEEKEAKLSLPFKEIIDHLNERAGTKFKASGKKTQDLIKARINDGFSLDDFKTVIDKKCAEWLRDPKMSNYLRPETLFSNKFEGYLNQKGGLRNGQAAAASTISEEYQLGF